MARINRILQDKRKKDALSIGEDPAEFKYKQALARLNTLQTAKDLDDFEKSIYSNPGLPEDEISDEEYDARMSGEPFGQDLDNQGSLNDRQNASSQGVVQNEPQKSGVSDTGPAGEANKAPGKALDVESMQTAKKAPPGGFVQRVRSAVGRRFGRGGAGGAGGGEAAAAGGGGGNLIGRARVAAQEAIKNIGKTIAKQFTKTAIKAFFANPYTWIVLGAIVLIFFAIVIPFGLLGQVGKGPSATGKSWHQETNPTKNGGTIRQVLRLGGEKTIVADTSKSGLESNKSSVIKMKDEVVAQNLPNKDDVVAKADAALASLDLLLADNSSANAKQYLTDIKVFLNLFENQIPAYPAGQSTRFPLDNPTLTFNTELHGGSYKHPDHVDSHGVYTAYDEGSCDAFDIAAESGKTVYPVFGGQVVDRSSDGQSGEKVVIKDGDYQVLIAHLTNVGVKKGDTVTTATPLGVPLSNHIQIETIYKTSCLTTTAADLIDFNTTSRIHDKIGGYLYDHFKTFFHLQ